MPLNKETKPNFQTGLFQTERILIGNNISNKSPTGSNGNEGVLYILQIHLLRKVLPLRWECCFRIPRPTH